MQQISVNKTYHTIHQMEIYPLESVIQPSNNWSQMLWTHCSPVCQDRSFVFIADLLSFCAQQMSFIIHIYANAKYCNHCGTEKDESEQNMCDCDVTLSFSLKFNFSWCICWSACVYKHVLLLSYLPKILFP